MSGPAVTSRSAALSLTERLTTCSTMSPFHTSPTSGPSGFRPRVGLSPTRPQHAAGPLIEPPPSLACATGNHARGNGGRRATARAAWGELRIPRIQGRARGYRLGGSGLGQLRRVGLADDDQARGLPTPQDLAVIVTGPAVEQPAATIRRHSRIGNLEVLEKERDAGERSTPAIAPRPQHGPRPP